MISPNWVIIKLFFSRETIRLPIMPFSPVKSQSVSIKFRKAFNKHLETLFLRGSTIFSPHNQKTFSLFSFQPIHGRQKQCSRYFVLLWFEKQLWFHLKELIESDCIKVSQVSIQFTVRQRFLYCVSIFFFARLCLLLLRFLLWN